MFILRPECCFFPDKLTLSVSWTDLISLLHYLLSVWKGGPYEKYLLKIWKDMPNFLERHLYMWEWTKGAWPMTGQFLLHSAFWGVGRAHRILWGWQGLTSDFCSLTSSLSEIQGKNYLLSSIFLVHFKLSWHERGNSRSPRSQDPLIYHKTLSSSLCCGARIFQVHNREANAVPSVAQDLVFTLSHFCYITWVSFSFRCAAPMERWERRFCPSVQGWMSLPSQVQCSLGFVMSDYGKDVIRDKRTLSACY